jgi:hypothetical protein
MEAWLYNDPGSCTIGQVMSSFPSRRAAVQSSRHVLCRNPVLDHAPLIAAAASRARDNDGTLCRKVIVPAALKPETLRRLRLINIMGKTLFLDADGFGKSIREFVWLAGLDAITQCSKQTRISSS